MGLRLIATAFLAIATLWGGQALASTFDDAGAVRLARDALGRLPPPYADSLTVVSFADEERRSGAPAPGITLVVGDSRTSAAFMDVTRNCRAEAASRQIRCDVALLGDLAGEFGLGDDASVAAELFAVILSHELGHLAFNHRRAGYHGGQGGISVLDYASHRTELQADAFAVELLDRTADPVSGVYRLIEYLGRAAQHRSICPDVFPAACPCPGTATGSGCTTLPVGPGLPGGAAVIRVTLRGSHPEYVVRFIRMLHLSTDARVRAVYVGDALFELRKMVVRDEGGAEQSLDPLFRESRADADVRARARRLAARTVARGRR